MTTAVVFIAGPVPPLDSSGTVPGAGAPMPTTLRQRLMARITAVNPTFYVAADGGLDLALGLGVEPGFVVGDMDSVSSDALEVARQSHALVEELPRAKDASDYELALDLAVSNGADHIVVVGGASGRLDHIFATIVTLTSPRYKGLTLEAWLVDNYLAVINGEDTAINATSYSHSNITTAQRSPSCAVVEGTPGEQVSIFAVGGDASGVSTDGLRWVLNDSTLPSGSSLGVSNELVDHVACVRLRQGTLAVFRSVDSFPSVDVHKQEHSRQRNR